MRWRFRRQPESRFWITGAMSLLLHGAGVYGIAKLPNQLPPRAPEQKVLQLKLVPRNAQPTPPTPPPEAHVEVAPTPAPQPPKPAPTPPPPPAVAPPSPAAPPSHFAPPRPKVPRSFASWRQRRMAPYTPSRFPTRGPGEDSARSEGRDRCEPMAGRKLDRLYLLYDASGSMNGALQGQALRCAQQYAAAALADGADVVVGSFAGTTVLSEPTRNPTDVALALRAPNDYTQTLLPSTELYRTFDAAPDADTDLVILSDGYIPNYRSTLASYRYFLELNPENRAYLYTLGVPGHPAVTTALKNIGFDVYIYRLF